MNELQFLATMRGCICRKLEGLIAKEERDESWARLIDKASRAVNMGWTMGLPYSEDFVNANVIPLLKRARQELNNYIGCRLWALST